MFAFSISGFEKHTRGYEISWSLGVKNKGSCPIAGVLFSRFVKKVRSGPVTRQQIRSVSQFI